MNMTKKATYDEAYEIFHQETDPPEPGDRSPTPVPAAQQLARAMVFFEADVRGCRELLDQAQVTQRELEAMLKDAEKKVEVLRDALIVAATQPPHREDCTEGTDKNHGECNCWKRVFVDALTKAREGKPRSVHDTALRHGMDLSDVKDQQDAIDRLTGKRADTERKGEG